MSAPVSPGAFADLLKKHGGAGKRKMGSNATDSQKEQGYYRRLEAKKKEKLGSVMYERKKMVKMLKKHLTKLIMGVKGVGAAPDWQLAPLVISKECNFFIVETKLHERIEEHYSEKRPH